MDNNLVRALPIPTNENLLSAWNAVVTAAVRQSRSGESICNIVVGDDFTRIAICSDGYVIDTAAFALGGQTLQIDDSGTMLEISESGETFLDALAKKIKTGDQVEEELVERLSNLIGETIINLLVRKRPPQISMRLLESEPLISFHTPYKFLLSSVATPSRMSGLMMNSLKDSIEERDFVCQSANCVKDDQLILDIQSTCLATVAHPPCMDMVPVLRLASDSEAQMDERRRRYSLSKSSPYVVLVGETMIFNDGVNRHQIAQLSEDSSFAGNWYLKSDGSAIELVKIIIAKSEESQHR